MKDQSGKTVYSNLEKPVKVTELEAKGIASYIHLIKDQ